MKDFLNADIGSTVAAATCAGDASLLGVDLSSWGGGKQNQMRRDRLPCKKMVAANRGERGYRAYLSNHGARLFTWHQWA
eukprot:6210819-Pleurochrysis_carterae.AAC.1